MSYKGAGNLLWYEENNKVYVLLGKRAFNPGKGKWSIIGGGWERKDGYYNDHPNYKKTAIRELKEETGFIVNEPKYLKRIWNFHSCFFSFEVFAIKCKKKILPKFKSYEFKELKWFSIDKIPEDCQEFVPTQIESLKDRLKIIKK